jgi:REP element-mobilizing transposase RayT
MRANRVLAAKGWYWVSTDVNNREGVFRLSREVRRLRTVLHEARKIYEFEIRGLRVEDDRVSFYINAADGVAVILLNRDSFRKNRSNFEEFEENPLFLRFFRVRLKQNAHSIALYTVWGKFFPLKHGEEVCI